MNPSPYWPRLTYACAACSKDVVSWATGARELYLGGDLRGEQGDGKEVGVLEESVCTPGWFRPQGQVTRALFSLPTCLSLYSCSQTVRSVMMVLITEAKRSCVWWAGGLSHPPSPESSFLPLLRLVVCHLFSQSPLVLACGFLFSIWSKFTLWGISLHTHACTSSLPALSPTPPLLRKGGKEEENSWEWIGVGCDLYTTWQPIPQLVLAPQVEQMEQIDRIVFTHPGLKAAELLFEVGSLNVFFPLPVEFWLYWRACGSAPDGGMTQWAWCVFLPQPACSPVLSLASFGNSYGGKGGFLNFISWDKTCIFVF